MPNDAKKHTQFEGERGPSNMSYCQIKRIKGTRPYHIQPIKPPPTDKSLKGRPHTFENNGFKMGMVDQGKRFLALTCA